MLTKLVGEGPAATVAANVPDLDHFSNRGGKDIIPLWRNDQANQANVTAGLLELISQVHGRTVSAEELFAYAYGVLSACRYTERYSEELSEPGPRLPITKNKAQFRRAVEEGQRLIHLHTFGERGSGPALAGRARCCKAVPNTAERYPEDFEYREADQTLRVGAGEFTPVSKAVWEFSVSGLQVLNSWLGYRMKVRSGKKSSPLDDIRPETWPDAFSEELLQLLWVLERTVDAQPQLAALLDDIVAGPLFTAAELSQPTEAQRQPPGGEDSAAPAQQEIDL